MIRCPQCEHFSIDGATECERCNAPLTPTTEAPADAPASQEPSLAGQVLSIAATGGTIAAIKYYRQQTGLGLKDSKEAVEALLRQHNVAPKSGCSGMILLAVAAGGAAAKLLWST